MLTNQNIPGVQRACPVGIDKNAVLWQKKVSAEIQYVCDSEVFLSWTMTDAQLQEVKLKVCHVTH